MDPEVRNPRQRGSGGGSFVSWLSAPTRVFRSSLAGKFSVVLLALLIPLVLVSLLVSRGLSSNAEDLLRARRVKELAAHSLSLVLTQDDVTKEILLDVERISEAQRKIDAYDANAELMAEIGQLTDSPDVLETLDALRRLDEEALRPLDSRVLEALTERGSAAAAEVYFTEYQPVRARYVELTRRLMRQAETVAQRAEVELAEKNRRSMLEVVAALITGIALVAAITVVIARHVRRRLATVVGVLEDVAEGDLRGEFEVDSEDEIGRMACALNDAVAGMGGVLVETSRSADRVQNGTRSIARAAELLARTAADQRREMGQASESMDEVTAQVWGIAETARSLRTLVDAAATTVAEIASMSDEFQHSSGALVERIDDTSRALEEIKAGVARVDAATEVLSRGAEATSGSMSSMAREMDAVDRFASRCAELWQRMVERGEEARAKVLQTAEGVESMREATRDAQEVVEGLGVRADEIGTILDVINAVADETKLLALNAAIIAAQSGEQGRAFAVVADQIRGLAQRVTHNTQEIETRIRAVQAESVNAIQAMGRGVKSVDEVVGLSLDAGEAVEEITRSSSESGEQIQEIARGVREQSRAAQQIVERMQQTEAAIGEIRSAVSRHGESNETMLAATGFMQEAAQQIRATAIELVRSTERIRESIDGVKHASESVEDALQVQTESMQSISGFLDKVGKRASENSHSAELTSQSSRELSDQSDALQQQVRRFRLRGE